jgi:uncharacterized membrane protein YeaQ/YmgE (transglycosylase-associated protein family)
LSIVGWIFLGAIVGFLANWLFPGRFPEEVGDDLIGGILGACLGGGLFALIADGGVTRLDFASLVVACISAALLLSVVRWVERRGAGPTDPITNARANPTSDGHPDPRPR